MRYGLDYSYNSNDWDARAKEILAAGKTFVGRYLGAYFPSNKNIKKTELETLIKYGIDIFFFYEAGADDALEGFDTGVKHAIDATTSLERLGLPKDWPVYYCVDISTSAESVMDYFNGVLSVVDVKSVGIYGGGYAITGIRDAGLASYSCQTSAFPGKYDPRNNLIQKGGTTIGPKNYGLETAYTEDFGQYSRTEEFKDISLSGEIKEKKDWRVIIFLKKLFALFKSEIEPKIEVKKEITIEGEIIEGGETLGSRADVFYGLARATVGFDYDWGGVLFKAFSGTTDRDQLTPDCSGLLIGLWSMTGTKFKKGDKWVDYSDFFRTSRPTSRTMYSKCSKIVKPSKFGDLGFRKDSSGVVRHVLVYLGKDKQGRGITVEAGYHAETYSVALGRSLRGSGHVGLDFVDWQNSKGVVWGRVPTDLGERTPEGGEPLSPFPWWPETGWGSWTVWNRLYKSLVNQIMGPTFKHKMWERGYGYYTWLCVRECRKHLGLPEGGQFNEELIMKMITTL